MGKSREQKVHDTVKRRLDHARNYWAPDNEMYGRTLDFCLFLNHYKNDPGFTRDKRRIQPKTQRQFNLIRHKASLLLRQMPEFDTRAVQPGADAHAAEVSRRIIEEIFHDPLKAYHDPRSRMVWSALAAGPGTIAIEWHKRWGVCFQFRDPRRIHLSPGNVFMHSVFNDAVYEEVPMRWSAVQRMGWDIPKDLAPDGGMFEHSMAGDREADGIEKEEASHLPGADEHDTSDPVVTIAKAWFREDPYRKVPSKLENADLPEEEWHFVDDALGVRYPWDPTNPIPPMSEATGQPLRLVTRRDEMFDAPSTDDKGHLVIIAPRYHGRKPLYEGSWVDGALNPDAYLSSFPYMELTCYKHPLRRTGISDTEATVSLTVIDNQSVRSTYEQMRTAGGVLVTQAGALEDSEGNQFKFSDEPIAIAYAKDRLSLESTNFFQAPGMNAAMPAFRNMIESQWQHIGTGDFAGSLGPDRSKDIAVGTANMLQQTGDLPVQLHAQDLSVQEAIGARIALDYCAAYMGDNVVSWVTDEGEQASMVVRGSDLVPLNVTVRANKEWRQQDVDRVQATAQLLGMISKLMLPPQAIAVLLKDAGLSPSVTEALVGAMQQSQMQQPPPGGPSSGGAPDLEVVPGGANEINGAQRR